MHTYLYYFLLSLYPTRFNKRTYFFCFVSGSMSSEHCYCAFQIVVYYYYYYYYYMMMMVGRAILREIQWLRLQQQASASPCSSTDHTPPSHHLVSSSQSAQQLACVPMQCHLGGPVGHLADHVVGGAGCQVVDELRLLRRRRDALQCRMMALQSSRRQLIMQLDSLMTVLKVTVL